MTTSPLLTDGTPGSGTSASFTATSTTAATHVAVANEIVLAAPPATLQLDDAQVTDGSPIVTSAIGGFTADMVGRPIDDNAGYQAIPAGATVLSRQSTNQITLSANAIGSSDADDDTILVGGTMVTLPDLPAGSIVYVVTATAAGVQSEHRVFVTGSFGNGTPPIDVGNAYQFVSDGSDWWVLLAS